MARRARTDTPLSYIQKRTCRIDSMLENRSREHARLVHDHADLVRAIMPIMHMQCESNIYICICGVWLYVRSKGRCAATHSLTELCKCWLKKSMTCLHEGWLRNCGLTPQPAMPWIDGQLVPRQASGQRLDNVIDSGCPVRDLRTHRHVQLHTFALPPISAWEHCQQHMLLHC